MSSACKFQEREIYRIKDGAIIGVFGAHQASEWLRDWAPNSRPAAHSVALIASPTARMDDPSELEGCQSWRIRS